MIPSRMRVLFVCHRVPFPPKRGGKIRPFNIVRHLHERGHEVTVASLARNEQELAEAAGLAQHCAQRLIEVVGDVGAWLRMMAWVPTLRPSSFGYFHSRRLAQRIRAASATGRWDLIFVHCSSVAPYVQEIPARVKILDFGDMDSQKWREYSRHRRLPWALGYWLEAVKLERTERLLAGRFDLSTCTTAAEWRSLRDLGAPGESDWFPNGVDGEFFAPSEEPYDPDLVAFVGRMDYFPNQQAVLTFCDEILPELQRLRPGTRFAIVGADPPPRIRALGQRPGVTVTGSVPDVRPLVRRAALTVAPLEIARGTQNKILESMALGVPVVCSRQAAGGVDAVPGEHLLVYEQRAQAVSAILSVLNAPPLRARLAHAARQRVLSHHSWAASMRRLEGLIAAQFARVGAAPHRSGSR
ncbi:MAG: TIGR03087 family PEP-CTERM/XrtA system glycosyltransferase [Steroidobacteraceae bacterium]|nr:TIGR03087 family PEP-CTERM/XrtA system glycosyltransferase [Steroidobacteraceae bacterium]MDW8258069.1 TIGR03087 family PEP-CTERM/XrtA system glycosyltransferase [Gammaproteobacteria bacterium]